MAAQGRQHVGVALGRAHPAPLGQTVPEGEQGLPWASGLKVGSPQAASNRQSSPAMQGFASVPGVS